ncbi:MAG: hypothetical protein E6J39_01505 [Chloroflexi bacterium]|nr:MAG: hypothetical protein E6J39_01505 [Chloroflexota bacterium]
MTALWLLAAVIAGVSGGMIGWPAWREYQARQAGDLNAERYLAWRGRASRSSQSAEVGPTPRERRRLLISGILLVAAIGCVIVYLTVS